MAGTLPHHDRQHGSGAIESAVKGDRQHLVEVVNKPCLVEGADVGIAGIVEQDIDPFELLDRRIDEVLYLLGYGDIRWDHEYLGIEASDLVSDPFELFR